MPNDQDNDHNKNNRTETKRLISRENGEEIWEISISETMEDSAPEPPPPPSPGQTRRFAHVQEWLSYLCNAFKPTDRTVAYYFNLEQSMDKYAVLFMCNWKFDPADKEWVYYIENNPQDYYVLPDSEYKKLNKEEALKKMVTELKVFTETEEFRHSFFAKARAIAAGYRGEDTVIVK